MSLSSLTRVLPPPSNPFEIPSLDAWEPIENQIGRLPADYKAFVQQFGSGTIDRFLWIWNPFSKSEHGNLLTAKEPTLSALRELRESGEECPYPLHPEPGGLLPFGKSDNGDVLYWLTARVPEQWPVVVNAARDPAYEKFECDMTDFLAGILTRRLRCAIFPEDFPSRSPKFVSAPPN
jgi:hypothetical protein